MQLQPYGVRFETPPGWTVTGKITDESVTMTRGSAKMQVRAKPDDKPYSPDDVLRLFEALKRAAGATAARHPAELTTTTIDGTPAFRLEGEFTDRAGRETAV